MGFDLYGENPENELGEYFRNNVWWWRPLWSFVTDMCIDILDERDIEGGGYNNGHLITKEKAREIGSRLNKLILDGTVVYAQKKYVDILEKLPDEKCDLCDGTGQRNDAIVQGQCNGCEGKGTRRPWQTNYPFNTENVKEFAEFCLASNGFTIC